MPPFSVMNIHLSMLRANGKAGRQSSIMPSLAIAANDRHCRRCDHFDQCTFSMNTWCGYVWVFITVGLDKQDSKRLSRVNNYNYFSVMPSPINASPFCKPLLPPATTSNPSKMFLSPLDCRAYVLQRLICRLPRLHSQQHSVLLFAGHSRSSPTSSILTHYASQHQL